jgi:hypothetical protein
MLIVDRRRTVEDGQSVQLAGCALAVRLQLSLVEVPIEPSIFSVTNVEPVSASPKRDVVNL